MGIISDCMKWTCPTCCRVMEEYKPDHFKCACGTRTKQLNIEELLENKPDGEVRV